MNKRTPSLHETLELLAKTNKQKYNKLKLIEELTELSEVLIKKVNKKGTPKEPSNQELIDELGDVLIRISILSDSMGLSEKIAERIKTKTSKLQKYYNENKFKGRI